MFYDLLESKFASSRIILRLPFTIFCVVLSVFFFFLDLRTAWCCLLRMALSIRYSLLVFLTKLLSYCEYVLWSVGWSVKLSYFPVGFGSLFLLALSVLVLHDVSMVQGSMFVDKVSSVIAWGIYLFGLMYSYLILYLLSTVARQKIDLCSLPSLENWARFNFIINLFFYYVN